MFCHTYMISASFHASEASLKETFVNRSQKPFHHVGSIGKLKKSDISGGFQILVMVIGSQNKDLSPMIAFAWERYNNGLSPF